LEFEKVYYPYLLISKKRYAGLYWTKPEKYDKMDTKGIEVSLSIQFSLFSSAHVPLDEHLMQACLDDTGHETAIVSSDSLYCLSYVKQVIADLLQNKVDMSQLVITKALAKNGW
jgi:DNA polymerase delta subunit 1